MKDPDKKHDDRLQVLAFSTNCNRYFTFHMKS